MTFKSILVYRDRGTSANVQLALAGKLAEDHNAQIVGLAVRQTQIYPMGFVELIPQDVINSISAQTEEAIDALCKSFRVTRAASGVSANSEWRDATGDPAQQIAVHGRYSDLIVIRQPDPDVQSGLATELADNVVLQAGRLILVTPYTQRETEFRKRIMIAWNGSREAARAVADAMPLLKRATSVDVQSANPDGIGDEPGADIGHFLARHGITVEVSHTLHRRHFNWRRVAEQGRRSQQRHAGDVRIRPFSIQRDGPWRSHPPYPSPHDGPDIAVALIRLHHCRIRA